jgi:hypothetical protein
VVKAEQRVTKSAAAFKPLGEFWIPYTVHGTKGGRRGRVEIQADDRYVSVDDVAGGIVVLDVSAWPLLDREGRLYWDTDPFELVMSHVDAQAIVDAARRDARITAPDRPIRVGDAFLVRGLTDEHPSLAQASLVLDITAAAREAAKAALYGAVASTLDRAEAQRMKVTEQYEDAEQQAGYFDVRQKTGLDGAEKAS